MANACMNQLSVMRCVTTWAVCNKELITVLAVGPWLAWQAWRRRSGFPTGRPLAILVAAGLGTELIGNIGVQWGYEIVGLAVMVPAYTGFLLVTTAVLGSLLLGERASPRTGAAVALLIVAVRSSVTVPRNRLRGGQAGEPGAGHGGHRGGRRRGHRLFLLAIAIRHCVTGSTSHSAVVVIITASGVLSLGPLSLYHAGLAALAATPPQQYALMYAAGVCNLVAFLALVRGLELTTALHVNMINAGQVALAALAGVLFFGESCNRWLLLGIGLMLVGNVLLCRPGRGSGRRSAMSERCVVRAL